MEKRKYNRLKAVLAECEVTQKSLAEHLGVGTVSVSRWCNNEAQPSLETFYKIAEHLKVNVCDLLVKVRE